MVSPSGQPYVLAPNSMPEHVLPPLGYVKTEQFYPSPRPGVLFKMIQFVPAAAVMIAQPHVAVGGGHAVPVGYGHSVNVAVGGGHRGPMPKAPPAAQGPMAGRTFVNHTGNVMPGA